MELVIETFEMLSVHNTRSPSFPTFRTTLAFGITALIFELLMLFIYGFFIDYTFISSKVFDGFGPFLVFALGILVLVGTSVIIQASGSCSPTSRPRAGPDSATTCSSLA